MAVAVTAMETAAIESDRDDEEEAVTPRSDFVNAGGGGGFRGRRL